MTQMLCDVLKLGDHRGGGDPKRWPSQNADQWAFGRRAGIDWRRLLEDIATASAPS